MRKINLGLRRASRIGPAVLCLCVFLTACIATKPRMGMVVDPDTGLQFGSWVENTILVDPDLMKNPKVKLTIRNTSGDPAFDLLPFRGRIESAFAERGFEPTRQAGFGLLVDVNVVYSGQITETKEAEWAAIGAAAGGMLGYAAGNSGNTYDRPVNATLGGVAGAVGGATIGSIIGSFDRHNTYAIYTMVSVLTPRKDDRLRQKTISFDSSRKREKFMDKEKRSVFRDKKHSRVLAYAGGRNTDQSEIAEQVRQRLVRILSNMI